MTQLSAFLARCLAHWRGLAPREQSMSALAGALIVLALFWWLLLAPPLRTLAQAEAQQRSLNAQLETMLGLQLQAKALQSETRINRDEAVRALEASVRLRLGSNAQISVVADSATLTLRGVPATALAEWLAQARVNAHAIPTEARLQRSTAGPAASTATPSLTGTSTLGGISSNAFVTSFATPPALSSAAPLPAWDGTLVLRLPTQ